LRLTHSLVALGLGAGLVTAPVHVSDLHVMGGVNIPAPQVMSASAYSAMSAYGGRTLISARVNTAVTSCQLKLLSHQSFAVRYASNARYCHVNFYAYVSVAANPTPVYRTLAFEVIGRNAWGQFSRGTVYLNVAPKGSNYHMPPPPVVKTTQVPPPPVTKAVPAAPSPPAPSSQMGMGVTQYTSDNWSGYEVTGSNFTSVTGTFTVPELETDETCNSDESQWVGIDGDSVPSLIQAGISISPYDSYGECNAPDSYYINAWYELLPAYQQPIDSIFANFGDQIKVNITDQYSPGVWHINMWDLTNGENWNIDIGYNTPGTSAEWITESSTDHNNCGGQCTLTGYDPAVTYSGLSFNNNAHVSSVEAETLDQNGQYVSTPSSVANLGQLLSQGFSTSYTGF
jgi:Peptidase A4 family